LPHEGETSAEAFDRWKAEFNSLQLDPASVQPGSETAQETFNHFLKEDLAPSLRSLGFKGSGAHYRLDRGDYQGTLGFQKDRHSTRAVVGFTINVSAGHRPTKRGYWGGRIGHLMPEFANLWWRVPHGADTHELLIDVVASIRDYALVALEAVLHDPEFPSDPDRIWPRAFGPDPVHSHLRNIPPTLLITTEPRFDIESAFAALTATDYYDRFQAMDYIYRNDPDNHRFVAALTSFLEREPRTYTRGVAALFLAFVSTHNPTAVQPALLTTATEDEDLDVRLNARYALALTTGLGATN
jgi:hypothetical protein